MTVYAVQNRNDYTVKVVADENEAYERARKIGGSVRPFTVDDRKRR